MRGSRAKATRKATGVPHPGRKFGGVNREVAWESAAGKGQRRSIRKDRRFFRDKVTTTDG